MTVCSDNRLAGGDPDPDLEGQVGLRLVQVGDRLLDGQTTANGPLRIILMGDWGAEHGHDAVPDELVQRSPEPLDLMAQPTVIGAEQGTDVLGVGPIRPRGESGQVTEQHGDDPALLQVRSRGERGATAATEGEPLWHVGATGRAAWHGR